MDVRDMFHKESQKRTDKNFLSYLNTVVYNRKRKKEEKKNDNNPNNNKKGILHCVVYLR